MQENEFEYFYTKFDNITKDLGRKYSIHRKYLLKVMFFCRDFMDAKNIAKKIKDEYKINISYHTVYEILSFLEEMRVVDSIITLPNNTKKYQLNYEKHQDHLICTNCGKIMNFYDKTIENQQKKIYEKYNFIELSHTMILYGKCKECQNV